MTAEQVSIWIDNNKSVSDRAYRHLVRILEQGPVHPASLGDFRRDYDLPQPIAAWLGHFPADFIRTLNDRRCGGQPSVALAARQDDPAYWRGYRTVIPTVAEGVPAKRKAVAGLAWTKLGLKGENPEGIRAEIFRAFLVENFGHRSVDMVEASLLFKRSSGMSFKDFFGGLSAREIAVQEWGTSYCAWTPVTMTTMNVAPVNVSGVFRFEEVPASVMTELTELARRKVPERIDFAKLSEDAGISRETLLLGYLRALSAALSSDKNVAPSARPATNQPVAARRGISYFRRLFYAILGRKGRCRSHYLEKWVRVLSNSPDQDAKITCEDGTVVIGILLRADEEDFWLKVGKETLTLPIEEIVEIKGVERSPTVCGPAQAVTVEPTSRDPNGEDVGYSGMGHVVVWKNSAYGFVSEKSNTYFFSRSKVEDPDLLVVLDSGQTGQRVSFVVEAPRNESHRYPSVKITQWCESRMMSDQPYGPHAYYALGRSALHNGNLAGAKVYFSKVLENPQDEHFLSALKDLAELMSKAEPNKAYDLIEKHRTGFPADALQLDFERMEIIYLLRARRYAEVEEKIGVLLNGDCLEPNLREYYSGLLKQAKDEAARKGGESELLKEAAYVDLLMRQCDFHGLENDGIRSLDDLPKEEDSMRQARLLELQKRFKASWDLFCADVPVKDRKLYRNADFSREQLRYQLTDICLYDALGSTVPLLFSLRFYLWRKFQCRVYEDGRPSIPELLAYLVMIARLSVRSCSISRYWQSVLPLLICHAIAGCDGEEFRRIVEDEEYRNALLTDFPLSQEPAERVGQIVRALRLDGMLPEFTGICERLGISLSGADDSYADWVSAVRGASAAMSDELSTDDVDKIRSALECVPCLPDNEQERMDHVKSLLEKVGDFVRSEDYEQRVRFSRDIQRMVGDFERKCVLDNLTLPTCDVYYPVESALRDAVVDACSRAEVAPIGIRIEHTDTSIYYHDEGHITLSVRVQVPDPRLPPISDIRLQAVNREGPETESFFAGPLRGGSDHVFRLEIVVSADEISAGRGTVELRLEYTKETDDRVPDAQSERLEFDLEDDEFEPVPNPYLSYTRHPVKGRLFVGRDKMLSEISSVFDADRGGQCYILYGQRRSGKTSMMQNLERILVDRHFVYTQMSASEWVEGDALVHFANALESKVLDDYAVDIALDGLQEQKDPMARIRDLSRLLKRDSGMEARTWVIAIDEFTYLHDYYLGDPEGRYENVLQFLRAVKALLEEKMFHLLLIGQESVVQMQREFANELAIWRLHRLSYLREEDVRRLADEPTRRRRDSGELESRYKGRAFARLFELTSGQPWLTLQFCSEIVEYLNGNKVSDITERVIESVRERMCVGDLKLVDETFEPFVHLMDPSIDADAVLQLYYLLAERTEQDSDWVPMSEIPEEFRPMIPTLERRSLVLVHGDSVRLRMGLFAAWLRANPGRTKECFGKAS